MTTKKATKTVSKTAKQAPALEAPQANNESREALVKKAQAAKQAAALGLIPQEQADALWAEAQAACKPSPEAVAKAEAARKEASEAEKVAKAARTALAHGLITEEKAKEAVSKAEAAHAAYKEAAREAKGFSFSGGGSGVRFKGQMSGLDAAYKVLSENATPLNATAITKAALETGLWAPEGQTPAMTLSAALQRHPPAKMDAKHIGVLNTSLFRTRFPRRDGAIGRANLSNLSAINTKFDNWSNRSTKPFFRKWSSISP